MRLLDLFKKKPENQSIVRLVRPSISRAGAILPDNTPLHLRRGWRQRGRLFEGYYRTRFGAWRGEIERHDNKFMVYIYKPPVEQLKRHSRWPCVHGQGGDKWRIDLAINPKDHDVGAIVFFVEKLILESFTR